MELPTRIPFPETAASSPLAAGSPSPNAAMEPPGTPLALGARIALHEVRDNLQLAAATPAKQQAAAVFTPLKQGDPDESALQSPGLELSPERGASSPREFGGGAPSSAYRIACHLPPELRGAVEAGGGVLYHHPLSSQQRDGWCRELSPSYVLSAGWLEGRCAPIDGGSYTLAYGDDDHRQLNFTVRVGLADGMPPTSVSWRLRGLGDDARVLPATTRVAEAVDGTPLACLYFDGLELLLARAETEVRARRGDTRGMAEDEEFEVARDTCGFESTDVKVLCEPMYVRKSSEDSSASASPLRPGSSRAAIATQGGR